MSTTIKRISALEILASGGYPTVEAEVELSSGLVARASVPYGASAGSHEATVLTDGGDRYLGKGMQSVVQTIENTIAPELVGQNPLDQKSIDQQMLDLDGTSNKATLGGNAVLAVSVAVARAAAKEVGQPLYRYLADQFQTGLDLESPDQLPQPMVVAIEGGKHADNTTDLQEYCLSSTQSVAPSESVRKVLESYHQLKKILQKEGLSTNVGNEGAFAPNGIATNEAPFGYLVAAIEQAGYQPGKEIGISIDAAASEFYADGLYHLAVENRKLTANELMAYYQTWLEKYPIATLEDMFHEDDWTAWSEFLPLTKKFNVPLIGDDLTVTNTERLQRAIDEQAISAILIKLNQIGSVSETIATCMLAKQHGMMTTTSHRGGGETNDTAMVDVAVAVGSRFIKVGPTRGERVSKYNRLLHIESEIKNSVK
ncbi:phosphopyruvate hydratase [Candidatus Woesebacteria bacterium]|nr:phosphopyruvate hydratase [Candidatus Woesebacteria bacterium]MCD8506827.1 phosphopyruvate hydratase [Candidatus Woesebacteria bacterium]MCD8527555.1 phosphopyruvate hydratase [Candidatus Woesebacteria bacterium]MCD8546295.1 phosphopyruvate hydratase [Candidatus Woesebacteria bacterium]